MLAGNVVIYHVYSQSYRYENVKNDFLYLLLMAAKNMHLKDLI